MGIGTREVMYVLLGILAGHTDLVAVLLRTWSVGMGDKSRNSTPVKHLRATDPRCQTYGGDLALRRVDSRLCEHLLVV